MNGYDLHNETLTSDSSEEHLSSRVLEKRIMISVALLGSFLFGFIFFGHAPSIIGLLVFLGPIEGVNFAPKLLGFAGILFMVLSFRWRATPKWLPATTVGSVSFLISWWLFFGLVDHNFITFLGTLPFLFFSFWFVLHLIRATGVFEKLNQRFATAEGVRRRVVGADFLASLTEPLKRWVQGKEENQGEQV